MDGEKHLIDGVKAKLQTSLLKVQKLQDGIQESSENRHCVEESRRSSSHVCRKSTQSTRINRRSMSDAEPETRIERMKKTLKTAHSTVEKVEKSIQDSCGRICNYFMPVIANANSNENQTQNETYLSRTKKESKLEQILSHTATTRTSDGGQAGRLPLNRYKRLQTNNLNNLSDIALSESSSSTHVSSQRESSIQSRIQIFEEKTKDARSGQLFQGINPERLKQKKTMVSTSHTPMSSSSSGTTKTSTVPSNLYAQKPNAPKGFLPKSHYNKVQDTYTKCNSGARQMLKVPSEVLSPGFKEFKNQSSDSGYPASPLPSRDCLDHSSVTVSSKSSFIAPTTSSPIPGLSLSIKQLNIPLCSNTVDDGRSQTMADSENNDTASCNFYLQNEDNLSDRVSTWSNDLSSYQNDLSSINIDTDFDDLSMCSMPICSGGEEMPQCNSDSISVYSDRSGVSIQSANIVQIFMPRNTQPTISDTCAWRIPSDTMSRASSFGSFRANVNSTKTVASYVHWVSCAESVGIIVSPNVTGTGFRVGPKYIITAAHVVTSIIESGSRLYQRSPLDALQSRKVFIDFGYIKSRHDSDTKRFYFKPLICFSDENLDFAILEMVEQPNKQFPPPFTNFDQVHRETAIRIIGHSNGEIKKFDKVPYMHTLTIEEKLAATSWSYQKVGYNGYDGIDDQNKVLFHCSFEKGASGAPGIVMKPDGTPVVVCMFIHGYPDWFYDPEFPEDVKENIPKHFLIEQAVTFSAIGNKLKKEHPDLFNDIFPQSIE